MYPVICHIGKFTIYSWGLMLAIAAIAGVIGVSRIARREGFNPDMVFDLVIISVLGGLLGARLLYVGVYEWEAFLADPVSMFVLVENGLSGLIWYGGFIGGLIPFAIYIWKKKLSFWLIADMFTPYLALGYALVRIGCFLSGCCYGVATDSVLGVIFPYVDSLSRHPTQLYSSAINFLLFVYLLWLYPRRGFSGQVFIFYLMGYSIYRFVIEFFRFNLIYYGPFSIGQLYSLILFFIALLLYLWRRNSYGKDIYVKRIRRY